MDNKNHTIKLLLNAGLLNAGSDVDNTNLSPSQYLYLLLFTDLNIDYFPHNEPRKIEGTGKEARYYDPRIRDKNLKENEINYEIKSTDSKLNDLVGILPSFQELENNQRDSLRIYTILILYTNLLYMENRHIGTNEKKLEIKNKILQYNDIFKKIKKPEILNDLEKQLKISDGSQNFISSFDVEYQTISVLSSFYAEYQQFINNHNK